VNHRFLLDTNVLSELLREQPNPEVLTKFHQFIHVSCIGSPTWHELWFGAHRKPPSAKRENLERFLLEDVLPHISILPYNRREAEWHAEERARLVSMGKTPPIVDGQIAAIAAVNGLILVTSNVSDFIHFTGSRSKTGASDSHTTTPRLLLKFPLFTGI
jgi:tRNA(fMet)-specific endonuclease VapC